MSRRLLFARFTAVLLFLMVSSIPATAQQRLFARVGSMLAEIDTSIARFGGVLRTYAFPTNSASPRSMVVAGGGRYIAWTEIQGPLGSAQLELRALDTVTGAVLSTIIDQPIFYGDIIGADSEGENLVFWLPST